MPGIVFGQQKLCPRCRGVGRLTPARRPVDDPTARALRGMGPVELNGRLIADPSEELLAAVSAQARLDTIPCTYGCSDGLVPA